MGTVMCFVVKDIQKIVGQSWQGYSAPFFAHVRG